MDNQQQPAKPSSKKKKGPIRTEAIVPFAIVMAVVILYFMLFFDGHLRRGIEWGASYLNAAEVNVGYLKTSFWKASFTTGNIEVTDKEQPEQNKVELGKIEFNLLWDALLRGKAVVELASVKDIQMGTKRKRPGKVFPPAESRSKLLEVARAQVSGTVLGDVARMLEGFDPSKALGEIGKLKSAEFIQQLSADLQQKEKAWAEALKVIPGDKDFAAIQGRLSAIQVGSAKSPAEIQSQVSQVSGLISEIDQKLKAVETQGATLKGDVNSFGSSVGSVDQLVKQDTQALEARIQLPKLDAKNIAKDLFGPKVVSQVAQAERYVSMARENMPAKSAKSNDAKPVSPPRSQGKLYQFGRPNSYPLFWLRKAEISSRMENTPLGGNVSGELLDIASSQTSIGRPARLRLEGDFPKRGFMGIKLAAVFDHRDEVPVESMTMSAASFPVAQRELSSSEDVKFSLAKAIGSAGFEGVLKGDAIQLKIDTSFREIDYQISAKSKLLESTLKSVVKDIPKVSVLASVNGTLSNPILDIQSNLASALAQGFQKQLQARVAEARQQIQRVVDERVGKQKAELTSRYQSVRGSVTGQIDEKRKKAEELKNQAMAKLTAVKNQLAPKGLEGIRKKLPF